MCTTCNTRRVGGVRCWGEQIVPRGARLVKVPVPVEKVEGEVAQQGESMQPDVRRRGKESPREQGGGGGKRSSRRTPQHKPERPAYEPPNADHQHKPQVGSANINLVEEHKL